MYSQGETFYYDIEDEEYELSVLSTFLVGEQEYLITEDFDGTLHVFIYDEDEDDIFLVEDEDEAAQLIQDWKDEYLDGEDIGDYEDDEYYDREDRYQEESYNEIEEDDEY
ncbi:hypothetical protein FSBG_01225 [Fusobacterium gonidiaformans 3-1-5R]|uniref:DUF1292 domain-containing protein n=2 Tax=Fusobacterium TaxID=848 RepID=E5BGV5_9FUSO|nr:MULTISPECIES: hypothetical protein [Fusobacterium]AVQ16823.1 hypothetical protein C4N16_04440 [Fusobacterium gonidiaformans ATCC 25563]EFS21728.1 hypothetical protein FSBG_01225 [Fusobacterium gonidiaformans 3-1-5R]EFS28403.1 hypothetical protein FGAG_00724 [Fusobacterium gonidiaformans ATCC 25563]KXA13109.1 hypothetical protein HMPREF3206_01567 [Fusobacterium equinum]